MIQKLLSRLFVPLSSVFFFKKNGEDFLLDWTTKDRTTKRTLLRLYKQHLQENYHRNGKGERGLAQPLRDFDNLVERMESLV